MTDIPVPDGQRRCPSCDNKELRRVGTGNVSSLVEYVRPHFRRRVFRRETLSCRCGHIVTAPAPDLVGDKTRCAPSFVAHLVVSKCNDSIPQYRLEKARLVEASLPEDAVGPSVRERSRKAAERSVQDEARPHST